LGVYKYTEASCNQLIRWLSSEEFRSRDVAVVFGQFTWTQQWRGSAAIGLWRGGTSQR